MASSNGRSRAPNFTLNEKRNLLTILEKYKDIIENKKTDNFWTTKKQRAWEMIAREFNATCSGHRTVQNLINGYKNLKKRTKQACSVDKMTSPGDGPTETDTSVSTNVMDKMKGEGLLDGSYSAYDNDGDRLSASSDPFIEHDGMQAEDVEEKKPFQFRRVNLKRKRKLKFKSVADQNLELIRLQRATQEIKHKDAVAQHEHNKKVRALELEELQRKLAHNEQLRAFELARA